MDCGKIVSRIGKLSLFLAIVLGACSWLPGDRQDASLDKSSANPVELVSGGLMLSESGVPELGLTLANPSAQLLWVSAHFQTPEGLTDCVLAKELEPSSTHLYSCPQPGIQADTDYPVQITIFNNVEQAEPLKTLDTTFRFSETDMQAIER